MCKLITRIVWNLKLRLHIVSTETHVITQTFEFIEDIRAKYTVQLF